MIIFHINLWVKQTTTKIKNYRKNKPAAIISKNVKI